MDLEIVQATLKTRIRLDQIRKRIPELSSETKNISRVHCPRHVHHSYRRHDTD